MVVILLFSNCGLKPDLTCFFKSSLWVGLIEMDTLISYDHAFSCPFRALVLCLPINTQGYAIGLNLVATL